MKQSKFIMGMPVVVEIVGCQNNGVFSDIFDFLQAIDDRFSTYKSTSEVSQFNTGLPATLWSNDLKLVLFLSEHTRRQTDGYFNINKGRKIDPSGLVKGWAIQLASNQLRNQGYADFYIEIGGDVQTHGVSENNQPWIVGVRNPFNRQEIVKTVCLHNQGMATSGTYIRGQHIYNPHHPNQILTELVSLSVIGPNIYEADRYATAAFAMGIQGIHFIEGIAGLEGYMIDNQKRATLTTGFKEYTL